MTFATNDQTGRFAELRAALDLSRPVLGRYSRPLFRATSLGEKYPTIDFLVDLLNSNDESIGFFFAQVKGTSITDTSRLSVQVNRERYNRMVRLSAPTYLIGVDVGKEASFIVAARDARQSDLWSMTKAYNLKSDSVKIKLYREVLKYWRANRPILLRTEFNDA